MASLGSERKRWLFDKNSSIANQFGEYIAPEAFLHLDIGLDDIEAAQGDLLAYLEDGGTGYTIGYVASWANFDKMAGHPTFKELLRRTGYLAPVAGGVSEQIS